MTEKTPRRKRRTNFPEKAVVRYIHCPGVLDRVARILARDFDRWLKERAEREGGR